MKKIILFFIGASLVLGSIAHAETRIDGLPQGASVVTSVSVTCNDAGDTCAYTAGRVVQHYITAGTDGTADTMTVTVGVEGDTHDFTLVGGTDDVVIDVNAGTDLTLTGASEESVTYRYNATTAQWHII